MLRDSAWNFTGVEISDTPMIVPADKIVAAGAVRPRRLSVLALAAVVVQLLLQRFPALPHARCAAFETAGNKPTCIGGELSFAAPHTGTVFKMEIPERRRF